MKGQAKKQKRLERQNELLKNFEGDFYQEKKVGDEWYIKSYNGGTKRWQVSIYSEISYNNYKSFQDGREPKRQKWNIKPLKEWKRPTLESIKQQFAKAYETEEEINNQFKESII